jgi:hypothetical protein
MRTLATACISMHVASVRMFHITLHNIRVFRGSVVQPCCCSARLVWPEVTQPLTLSIRPDAFDTVSDSHPIAYG